MSLALSTYANLQTTVATWINRADDTDLLAAIPAFITLLEAQLSVDLRWRKMIARDQTIADEQYESLPEDYLELEDIKFFSSTGRLHRPKYRTPSQLDAVTESDCETTGIPRYFTIENNEIRFDRVPDSVTLEILSYVRLPALSDENPSNVLLAEYPNIYLFGTLMQAEAYLKNDPRIATWAALYRNAVDALMTQDERASEAPGPLAITTSRVF